MNYEFPPATAGSREMVSYLIRLVESLRQGFEEQKERADALETRVKALEEREAE